MTYIITAISIFVLILGIVNNNKIYLVYSLLIILGFLPYLKLQYMIMSLMVILFLVAKRVNIIKSIRNKSTLTLLVGIFIFNSISAFMSKTYDVKELYIKEIFFGYYLIFSLIIICWVSISDFSALRKIIYFYMAVVFIEMLITGPVLFLNLPMPFLADITSLANIDNLYHYSFLKRFRSGSHISAINITPYLLGVMFVPILKYKKKLTNIAISPFAILFSILTWSRTLFIGTFFSFALSLFVHRKIDYIKMIVLLFVTLSMYSLIGENILLNISKDHRLMSRGNFDRRLELSKSYYDQTRYVKLFYGNYEDVNYLYEHGIIAGATSSENTYLEMFFRSGIIAGVFYLFLFVNAIYKLSLSYKTVKIHSASHISAEITKYLFTVFLSVSLMIFTFTISFTSPIVWILIIAIDINYHLIRSYNIRLGQI